MSNARPRLGLRANRSWAWLWLLACACGEPDPFPCAVESDCVIGDNEGRCERNAYCTYPDVACQPGRRWGPYAGDGLADGCTSEAIVLASYAGCAGPTTPPLECSQFAGPDRIDVDILDGDTLESSTGYLYFDLDAIPDTAVVLSAQVELTAPDSGEAWSDAAGSIVPVEPFTVADLESGRLPAALPSATPSSVQGGVELGQTIVWDLEPTLLVTGQRLHLALEAGSTENAQYWSTTGPVPPRLLLHVSR